jgi:hypothetical protein
MLLSKCIQFDTLNTLYGINFGTSSNTTNISMHRYHSKVANNMAAKAPEGTLTYIISNQCPSMTDRLKEENIAFFMEAITPAFASFWTICNICVSSQEDMHTKCKEDPVFRQQVWVYPLFANDGYG